MGKREGLFSRAAMIVVLGLGLGLGDSLSMVWGADRHAEDEVVPAGTGMAIPVSDARGNVSGLYQLSYSSPKNERELRKLLRWVKGDIKKFKKEFPDAKVRVVLDQGEGNFSGEIDLSQKRPEREARDWVKEVSIEKIGIHESGWVSRVFQASARLMKKGYDLKFGIARAVSVQLGATYVLAASPDQYLQAALAVLPLSVFSGVISWKIDAFTRLLKTPWLFSRNAYNQVRQLRRTIGITNDEARRLIVKARSRDQYAIWGGLEVAFIAILEFMRVTTGLAHLNDVVKESWWIPITALKAMVAQGSWDLSSILLKDNEIAIANQIREVEEREVALETARFKNSVRIVGGSLVSVLSMVVDRLGSGFSWIGFGGLAVGGQVLKFLAKKRRQALEAAPDCSEAFRARIPGTEASAH